MIVKLGYYYFDVPIDLAKAILGAYMDGDIREVEETWIDRNYVYVEKGEAPTINIVNAPVRTKAAIQLEKDRAEFKAWKDTKSE